MHPEYMDRGGYYPEPVYRRSSSFSYVILIVFILFFAFFLYGAPITAKQNITVSTVNREPLPASACIESPNWFEERVKWISNPLIVTSGMKKFYTATGVQPYLIITNNVDGKGSDLTDSEAELFLQERYDSLFSDEGHLIYLFMEYAEGQYNGYIYAGNQAATVIDSESREIIYDYFDYYYNADMDDDTYFATVFEKSAERIMRKTTTGFDVTKTIIIGVVFIAGLVIIGVVGVNRKKFEAQRAAEDRKILETPISNLSDDSLAEKYKKEEGNNDYGNDFSES